MRTAAVGIIAGLVAGAVIGATVVAPHIVPPEPAASAPSAATAPAAAPEAPVPPVPGPNLEVQAAAPAAKREPQLQWRVGSAYPSSLPGLGAMLPNVERRLWRVSDGDFALQIREPAPGESAEDRLRAVTAGKVEAVFGTPALWTERSPALQLFGATPFGMDVRPFLAWMKAGNGNSLLSEILGGEGLYGLVCGVTVAEGGGWFKKPVRTVEDLRGLKIRIQGLGARILDRVGAKVASTSDGSLLAAFDSGAVDAVVFSLPSTDAALQLQNLARYYYFPGWQAPSTLYYLITTAERWNSLSPIRKAQIETVCGDNVQQSLAEGDALQFGALRRLVREGTDVRRWPPEVLDALREAWNAVVDDESPRNTAFRKVLASMRAFDTDYRVWRELSAQ